jgi:hypothetical protein
VVVDVDLDAVVNRGNTGERRLCKTDAQKLTDISSNAWQAGESASRTTNVKKKRCGRSVEMRCYTDTLKRRWLFTAAGVGGAVSGQRGPGAARPRVRAWRREVRR